MAHSSEERDNLNTPLCGARRKTGDPCRAFAGQGTDHLGIGNCKYHGGSTYSHKQSAAVVEAKREMVMLGAPIDLKPHQALLGVLRATAGHVAWLNSEVGDLADLSDPDARVLVSLYSEERDRLARVSKACLESGISKVEIEITEKTSVLLARAVDNAFKSIGDLTAEQRKQFGQVLRLELSQLQTSAAEPGAASGT